LVPSLRKRIADSYVIEAGDDEWGLGGARGSRATAVVGASPASARRGITVDGR